MKSGEIYDREREWSALEDAWRRAGAALVMVLGRRRAGKSFLLARFAREVGGISTSFPTWPMRRRRCRRSCSRTGIMSGRTRR